MVYFSGHWTHLYPILDPKSTNFGFVRILLSLPIYWPNFIKIWQIQQLLCLKDTFCSLRPGQMYIPKNCHTLNIDNSVPGHHLTFFFFLITAFFSKKILIINMLTKRTLLYPKVLIEKRLFSMSRKQPKTYSYLWTRPVVNQKKIQLMDQHLPAWIYKCFCVFFKQCIARKKKEEKIPYHTIPYQRRVQYYPGKVRTGNWDPIKILPWGNYRVALRAKHYSLPEPSSLSISSLRYIFVWLDCKKAFGRRTHYKE